jgi:hypothetical protein
MEFLVGTGAHSDAGLNLNHFMTLCLFGGMAAALSAINHLNVLPFVTPGELGLCRWRSGRPTASRPGDGTFVAKAECPTSEAITFRSNRDASLR